MGIKQSQPKRIKSLEDLQVGDPVLFNRELLVYLGMKNVQTLEAELKSLHQFVSWGYRRHQITRESVKPVWLKITSNGNLESYVTILGHIQLGSPLSKLADYREAFLSLKRAGIRRPAGLRKGRAA